MVMSLEDSTKITELKTAINSYTDEMISAFLAGNYDIDGYWDTFISEYDNLNLTEYLQLLQSAYDKVYK